MDRKGKSGIGRRALLQAFGAATVATSAGVTAAGSPAAAGSRDYDVIVIGAGFAGVTAARDLRARGLRTLVLEARDRIGGRTWTESFGGLQIELGGQWVSEHQTLVMRELRRHGIPLVPDPTPDIAVFPTPSGPREFDPDEAYGRVAELVAMLFQGSEDYFPHPRDPLRRTDLLAPLDRLSLRDGIDQLALSPQDDLWLDLTVGGFAGGSSSHGALTALAQWWALAGWDAAGWFGIMAHRPASGMAGLLRAMLAEQPVDLRLRSEVTRVADVGGRVVVGTRGGPTFRARYAVVAVPVNVWPSIRFHPGLPRVHADAAREGAGVPRTIKLWLHVRGLDEVVIAEGGDDVPISSLIPAGRLADGQMLVGFGFDPSLDLSDRAEVEAAVRLLLPTAELVDLRAHDWAADRFARGAQALRQPGQLLRQLPRIQQPHGRIAFAGGDLASGWNGFVDGAIESGKRAAKQVITMAHRDYRGHNRWVA